MNMLIRGFQENLTNFGLAEESRSILCDDLPLLDYEPLIAEEVAGFRFLSGTAIWLDIVHSITAGTTPHLLTYHSRVIVSHSQTKLGSIMGCENWVMIQIGRIAALHEHITLALQQGVIKCTEFQTRVEDINRELHCGLAQGVLERLKVSENASVIQMSAKSDSLGHVTQMFAYMASIYLHLVTRGFANLESLHTTISDATDMLRTQISIHLLPALVCPLYIVGSVAREGDEQIFRNIFSSPPLVNPLFGHRGNILPILEQIWNRRRTTPGFTWKDSVEFTNDILLV